ncbi:NfeD family protein, partial [Arthrospira platensis SPKY1]|nr:NfeD family protein [Arthrospira platensis SPKY1]
MLPIAAGFAAAQLVRWAGASLEFQLVVIAASSLLALYLWRKLYRKTSPAIAEEQSLDIGRTVQILEWPEDGADARVQYRGAAWVARLSAKSSNRLPGVYRIVDIQGPALIVE